MPTLPLKRSVVTDESTGECASEFTRAQVQLFLLWSTYLGVKHETTNDGSVYGALYFAMYALEQCPEGDDLSRAEAIRKIGSHYRDLYFLTGNLGYLQIALRSVETSLPRRPLSPERHAHTMSNLASGYRELAEKNERTETLNRALYWARRAVRYATVHDLKVRRRCLNDYASALRCRGTLRAVRRAVALNRLASALITEDDPHRLSSKNFLANSLLHVGSLTSGSEAVSALTEAIQLHSLILESADREHNNIAQWTRNLAEDYEQMWRQTRDPEAYALAVANFRAAARAARGRSLADALPFARPWGDMTMLAGADDDAVEAWGFAVEVLEDVVGVQSRRSHQRAWLRAADAVPANLAYVHTGRGEFDMAMSALVSGRAREMRMFVAATLDSASGASEWVARRGAERDEPLDGYLGSVVGTGGTTIEIDREATQVCLVAANHGGFVLALDRHGTYSYRRIDDFSIGHVEREVRRLEDAYQQRDSNPVGYSDALAQCGRWLADCVGHFWDSLADDRIRLSLFGLLSRLPVQTMFLDGKHGEPTRSLPSSRHITFETGLPAAVVNPGFTDGRCAKAVFVGFDVDEDGNERVSLEAEAVRTSADTVVAFTPETVSLQHAVADAGLIYFACHGVFDGNSSENSRIRIGEEMDLTVTDILSLQLHRQPLVFLSSCDSGRADPTLPDQSLNFASAFRAAGAAAVVCPTVAVSRVAVWMFASRMLDYCTTMAVPQAAAATRTWMWSTTDAAKAEFVRSLPTSPDRDYLADFLALLPPDGSELAAPEMWAFFQVFI